MATLSQGRFFFSSWRGAVLHLLTYQMVQSNGNYQVPTVCSDSVTGLSNEGQGLMKILEAESSVSITLSFPYIIQNKTITKL